MSMVRIHFLVHFQSNPRDLIKKCLTRFYCFNTLSGWCIANISLDEGRSSQKLSCPDSVSQLYSALVFQLFIATMSNSLQQISIVLWKIIHINRTYGVPPQGHLQGHTCDNKDMCLQLLKETYIHVLLQNICRTFSFSFIDIGIWQELEPVMTT